MISTHIWVIVHILKKLLVLSLFYVTDSESEGPLDGPLWPLKLPRGTETLPGTALRLNLHNHCCRLCSDYFSNHTHTHTHGIRKATALCVGSPGGEGCGANRQSPLTGAQHTHLLRGGGGVCDVKPVH